MSRFEKLVRQRFWKFYIVSEHVRCGADFGILNG